MNSIYIVEHLQQLDAKLYNKTQCIHDGRRTTLVLLVIPYVADFCFEAFELGTPEP
jgi:hypothetical protein